jgi:hypothetical protein
MRAVVRFTIASIGMAVCVGLAVVTSAVLGVRAIQTGQAAPAGSPGSTVSLGSPAAILLLVGTVGGVLVAVAAGWALLSPIGSFFRRGGFAMVAGFATVVGMLFTMPVSAAYGQTGLIGLLAAELVALLLLAALRRTASA